jgi:hypothetical protein
MTREPAPAPRGAADWRKPVRFPPRAGQEPATPVAGLAIAAFRDRRRPDGGRQGGRSSDLFHFHEN